VKKWISKEPDMDAIVFIDVASPVVPATKWVYSTKSVYLEIGAAYMAVFSFGVLLCPRSLFALALYLSLSLSVCLSQLTVPLYPCRCFALA
jgi:hypothetical protein